MQVSRKISLPLITKKKTLTYKVIILIYIILTTVSIVEAVERNEYSSTLFIITVLFFITSQLFLDIRSLRIKEYRKTGLLTLNKDGLIIETDSCSINKFYTNLKSITLEINETSRDPIFKTGVVGMGLFNRKLNGIENNISFVDDKDEYFSFNFFIEDIETIKSIDSFLKTVEIPVKLKRKGQKIESIKTEHFKDYPPEYVNTKKQ